MILHEFKYRGNSFVISTDLIEYLDMTHDTNLYRVEIYEIDSSGNPRWRPILRTHAGRDGKYNVIHALLAEIAKLTREEE